MNPRLAAAVGAGIFAVELFDVEFGAIQDLGALPAACAVKIGFVSGIAAPLAQASPEAPQKQL